MTPRQTRARRVLRTLRRKAPGLYAVVVARLASRGLNPEEAGEELFRLLAELNPLLPRLLEAEAAAG